MYQTGSKCAALACFLLVSGCSGASEEGDLHVAGVADAEQGIGEATCATAPPNVNASGDFNWTSPRTYDNARCRKAVIVDDRTLVRQPIKVVQWADTKPTTPAACQQAYVTSTFYVRQGAGFVQAGQPRSDNGEWVDGACSVPIVTWHDKFELNYRIVASARTSFAEAAPTRSVRILASR